MSLCSARPEKVHISETPHHEGLEGGREKAHRLVQHPSGATLLSSQIDEDLIRSQHVIGKGEPAPWWKSVLSRNPLPLLSVSNTSTI